MKMNSLYWIKKEIQKIENQLEELTFIGGKVVNGMPSGNKISNPTEQFIATKLRLQEQLTSVLNKYISERERIEDEIEKIDDAEIRLIARMRFIDNMDYEDIGRELHLHRTSVYKKLKNKGLV